METVIIDFVVKALCISSKIFVGIRSKIIQGGAQSRPLIFITRLLNLLACKHEKILTRSSKEN